MDKGHEIQAVPGAIVLNNYALRAALSFLRGDTFENYDQKFWAFTCLMQLIESIVLHEQIFYEGTSGAITVEELFKAFDDDLAEFLHKVTLSGTGLEKSPNILVRLPPSLNAQGSFDPPRYVPPKHITTIPFHHEAVGGWYVDPEYSLQLAAHFGLAYKPAPWEVGSTQNLIQEAHTSYYASFASNTFDLIHDMASKEAEEMNKWLGQSRFKVEMPLVFNYVFEARGWNEDAIITKTLEMRDSKEVKAFRKVCSEFDTAAKVGDSKTMYRLQREVISSARRLNSQYNGPSIEIDIQFPLAISFKPQELWTYIQRRRKHHLVFIAKVYEAALRSEGKLLAFFKEA